MPQIWPMNWLFLFMFFIMTLLIFLCVFYFNISVETGSQSSQKNFHDSTFLNWKW